MQFIEPIFIYKTQKSRRMQDFQNRKKQPAKTSCLNKNEILRQSVITPFFRMMFAYRADSPDMITTQDFSRVRS